MLQLIEKKYLVILCNYVCIDCSGKALKRPETKSQSSIETILRKSVRTLHNPVVW